MNDKPLILISTSLLSDNNDRINKLKNYVKFSPIEIGNGLMVEDDHLVFSDKILKSLESKLVHGIIIESRLILHINTQNINIPIEDEKSIYNNDNWRCFLTGVFTLKRFDKVCINESLYELINFHSCNKYLLMEIHQQNQKDLGKLIANSNKKQAKEAIDVYYKLLSITLKSKISNTREINMLMHVFGYFKNDLSTVEKDEFLNLLDLYRLHTLSLNQILSLLYLWSVKYNNKYLIKQTIFNLFPSELI